MDPLVLLPEILLLVGALATLVAGSFLPRQRQWVARLIAVVALVAAGGAAAAALTGADRTVYDGTFTTDTGNGVARLIVVAASLLVIGLGVDELAGTARESETYVLLLLSADGVLLLAGATDLLLLAVAFLLASIPVYGLIGMSRTPRAAEAAVKTYLLGAMFGIVLLLGVTILFGVAAGTRYDDLSTGLRSAPVGAVAVGVVAVLAGLAFEAGAVPAHFWVPDAAQGSGSTAAAYLTTVPKVGALVAAYRLVGVLPDSLNWLLLVAVLAVASMTLGNLAAYGQRDPRRLLGWSTVSQVGYLLVPVVVEGSSDLALTSLLFYLAAYAVTNLGAFAVVAALPQYRDLAMYRGLAKSRPWLAAALAVCLLGLLGTPPTAVFVGKLTVATAAWDGGEAWLAVVLMANTVVSLVYYLRWLAPCYRPAQPGESTDLVPFVVRTWAAGAAITAAGVSIVMGLTAGVAWPR